MGALGWGGWSRVGVGTPGLESYSEPPVFVDLMEHVIHLLSTRSKRGVPGTHPSEPLHTHTRPDPS